ncbi:MAG: hypothetical protein ACRDQ5_16070, partial [Sciscionella sp.]
GLHYPVFRGLDEARTLLHPPRRTTTRHAATTTADTTADTAPPRRGRLVSGPHGSPEEPG